MVHFQAGTEKIIFLDSKSMSDYHYQNQARWNKLMNFPVQSKSIPTILCMERGDKLSGAIHISQVISPALSLKSCISLFPFTLFNLSPNLHCMLNIALIQKALFHWNPTEKKKERKKHKFSTLLSSLTFFCNLPYNLSPIITFFPDWIAFKTSFQELFWKFAY